MRNLNKIEKDKVLLITKMVLDFFLLVERIFRIIKMNLYYKFFLKRCGKGSLIIKPILLTQNCISLGTNVFIRNNCRIEGVFKFENQLFNPEIVIGNNVNIEQNAHITCTDSIFIGSNTSITANVTITDTIHNYSDVQMASKFQPLSSKKVVIGDNCSIYNNSIILPGTELGNNISVAANSVVSGTFPPYVIIGGNPAKIIKQYNFESNSWKKCENK